MARRDAVAKWSRRRQPRVSCTGRPIPSSCARVRSGVPTVTYAAGCVGRAKLDGINVLYRELSGGLTTAMVAVLQGRRAAGARRVPVRVVHQEALLHFLK